MSAQLLDPELGSALSQRWQAVQARFVDDPQEAVRQADQLVDEAMSGITARLSDVRSSLQSQWDAGGEGDTEQLRLTLQQYRTVLERLVGS